LQDSSTRHLSLSAIEIILNGLVDLFDALGFEGDNLSHDQISFHYPLHRYLAHFITNAVRNQGNDGSYSSSAVLIFDAAYCCFATKMFFELEFPRSR